MAAVHGRGGYLHTHTHNVETMYVTALKLKLRKVVGNEKIMVPKRKKRVGVWAECRMLSVEKDAMFVLCVEIGER